jgi:hypothetical protein
MKRTSLLTGLLTKIREYCTAIPLHTRILTFFSNMPQFTHSDLHSAGILRSVQLQFIADVSGQPTVRIFKG